MRYTALCMKSSIVNTVQESVAFCVKTVAGKDIHRL